MGIGVKAITNASETLFIIIEFIVYHISYCINDSSKYPDERLQRFSITHISPKRNKSFSNDSNGKLDNTVITHLNFRNIHRDINSYMPNTRFLLPYRLYIAV